jgi:hypothetical protein
LTGEIDPLLPFASSNSGVEVDQTVAGRAATCVAPGKRPLMATATSASPRLKRNDS